MSNLLRIGKRLIPIEHVALFEPYVPTPDSPIRTERDFKSRIVLLNRDSVLSETPPLEMAEIHSFRLLPADSVATNPGIRFGVEAFVPAENFTPSKDFLTRLSWHDLDGNSQSKLLLTSPETALSIAVRGDSPDVPERENAAPIRPRRKRANRVGRTPKP
jgi:hypothetical protein